ncbi:hypothetical protein HII31_02909 [Pseudocercospora fuligena]|uniref:Uncharacterized protein n=1 Tax=Pseudocercospora fuligena TaxID=685502 RepID=A0A8H6RQQ2_9PEZI|nr:hypothetical protein HII31_02909 [Pseudocercospora fuligena]
MATRMRDFLANSLTAVKNVFSRTSSPNAAANVNSRSDSQTSRRTRQPAPPAPIAGSRVLSGRVRGLAAAKRKRPCRSIEDYKFRLERLVSGIDSLENVEELCDERQAQIADVMMVSDIDPSIEQRIDTLIEQQGRAEGLIEKRLKILQADADALVQSIEQDSPTDRPPLLPFYLRSQLKTYDRARQIYQTQVNTTSNTEQDLDKITAILAQAKEQQPQRGWQYTRSYLERLGVRRAGICKHQRVAQSCRQRLTYELRKLCKQHAPKTLHDENFLKLFRKVGEQQIFLDQPKEPEEPVEATDELRQEWEAAQAKLKDCWQNYNITDPPGSLEKNCDGVQDEYEKLRGNLFGMHRSFHKKIDKAERRYRKVRDKAMRAGLPPEATAYTDLGEFTHHAEDDEAASVVLPIFEPEAEHRIQFWKEYAWMSSCQQPSAISLEPPDGEIWDDGYVSVRPESSVIGGSKAVTAARRAKIQQYRESCEELRHIANRDYARLK